MQSHKDIGGNIVKNDLFNDRISRFSIRKLNVGVCSVLLGTLVMLGTAANVSADEAVEDKKVEGVAATTEVESPANLPTVEEKAPETTYQADAAPVVPAEKTTPATTDKAEAPVTPTETAPTTTAPVEEKAPVVAPAPAQADKKEEVIAAGVEAPAKEEKAATVPLENTPKPRTRRAVGDPNDPSLIADDVEDATSTPKVEKPGFTTDIDPKSMTSQITWLDFGDVANWTGAKTIQVAKNEFKPNDLTESLALQVGAT